MTPERPAAFVQHVARCKAHGIAACTVCNPRAANLTVEREDVLAIIGEAYNLITQGESQQARRQPSARRIYEVAYRMLGETCPLPPIKVYVVPEEALDD